MYNDWTWIIGMIGGDKPLPKNPDIWIFFNLESFITAIYW